MILARNEPCYWLDIGANWSKDFTKILGNPTFIDQDHEIFEFEIVKHRLRLSLTVTLYSASIRYRLFRVGFEIPLVNIYAIGCHYATCVENENSRLIEFGPADITDNWYPYYEQDEHQRQFAIHVWIEPQLRIEVIREGKT